MPINNDTFLYGNTSNAHGEISNTPLAQVSNACGQYMTLSNCSNYRTTTNDSDILYSQANNRINQIIDNNKQCYNEIDSIKHEYEQLKCRTTLLEYGNNELNKDVIVLQEEIKELRKICARTNTALNNLIGAIQLEKFNKEHNK